MNFSIVGRHLELTDAIKSYIENLVHGLGKYHLNVISIRTIISAEEKHGKKGFYVEYTINLAKLNTIVIRQKDKDLYAAADLAIDRAHKVLQRYHDKITDHKIQTIEELSEIELAKAEQRDSEDYEIVPMDLELHKPLEMDEAVERLNSSKQHFYIFNDMSGKMRVIYKRHDNKYGLY